MIKRDMSYIRFFENIILYYKIEDLDVQNKGRKVTGSRVL